MNTLTKLDSRRRGVFPASFRPGDVVSIEASDAKGGTFRLQAPAEAPLVKPRRIKGRLFGADVPLDRKTIVAAIRADRDSR